jgi:phage shock protein A
MKRVISAGVEGAVDKAERATAPSLMRHSIREVEGLIDRARVDQATARARADAAAVEQKGLRTRVAELGEQARFAVEKGRADLAEAALIRQVEVEGQLARLDEVRAQSAREITELEASAQALAARKIAMEEEYSTSEAVRRAAERAAQSSGSSNAKAEQAGERARQAFDRALAASDGEAGGAARQLAEIDALKRESLVAERLAALRAEQVGGKPKKRAGR